MSLRANEFAIHLRDLADPAAADDAARDAIGRDVLHALDAIDRAAAAAVPVTALHASPALAGPGIYDLESGAGRTAARRTAALGIVLTVAAADSIRTTGAIRRG